MTWSPLCSGMGPLRLGMGILRLGMGSLRFRTTPSAWDGHCQVWDGSYQVGDGPVSHEVSWFLHWFDISLDILTLITWSWVDTWQLTINVWRRLKQARINQHQASYFDTPAFYYLIHVLMPDPLITGSRASMLRWVTGFPPLTCDNTLRNTWHVAHSDRSYIFRTDFLWPSCSGAWESAESDETLVWSIPSYRRLLAESAAEHRRIVGYYQARLCGGTFITANSTRSWQFIWRMTLIALLAVRQCFAAKEW